MERFVEWMILLMFFIPNLITGFEIRFLSIHSLTSTPYSLDYVGPAIDLAMEEVKAKYSNYSFSLMTFDSAAAKDFTCPDVEKDVLPFVTKTVFLHKTKDQNVATAILAPGMQTVR